MNFHVWELRLWITGAELGLSVPAPVCPHWVLSVSGLLLLYITQQQGCTAEILLLIPNTCCMEYLFCGNVLAPMCGCTVFSDDLIATFSLGREIAESGFVVHLLGK